MHSIVGEHPPDHLAAQGALWVDRDGLQWQQKSCSATLGNFGILQVRGGRDWHLFSPHGVRTGILWSSAAFSQVLSAAYDLNHAFTGTAAVTDSYHTLFSIVHTFRLKAMVLPVHEYAGGSNRVNVKLGLYIKQTDRVGWSFKLADKRLLFEMIGGVPTGSPFMIPFHSDTQDGLVLRKGCELYVRAVWGSAMDDGADTKLTARYPYEFQIGGDNCFRSDRKTSSDSDFTEEIGTLMATEYGNTFGTSLTGNATSMARVDWGMYGDFLD